MRDMATTQKYFTISFLLKIVFFAILTLYPVISLSEIKINTYNSCAVVEKNKTYLFFICPDKNTKVDNYLPISTLKILPYKESTKITPENIDTFYNKYENIHNVSDSYSDNLIFIFRKYLNKNADLYSIPLPTAVKNKYLLLYLSPELIPALSFFQTDGNRYIVPPATTEILLRERKPRYTEDYNNIKATVILSLLLAAIYIAYIYKRLENKYKQLSWKILTREEKKILELLKQQGGKSYFATLSDKIGLKITSLNRRIQKLKEKGIIRYDNTLKPATVIYINKKEFS